MVLLPLAAGTLAVTALAACGGAHAGRDVVRAAGPPAPAAVADGSYVRVVRLGGLLITPAAPGAAVRQGLTWREAAALFEAVSQVQGGRTAAMLGYGLVTTSGPSLLRSTPRMRRRGAWVGITWGGWASCPAEIPSPSRGASAPPRVPIYTAVVIYGYRGRGAFVYSSRGTPPCGGPPHGPTAAVADETYSVPWRQAGPIRAGRARVSYRAPACARLFSTSATGNVNGGPFTVVVEVTAPAGRPHCQASAVRTTALMLFPKAVAPEPPASSRQPELAHGRTGLVRVLQVGSIAGAPR